MSHSLKASLASGNHASAFQSRLGELMGIATADYWRPGAENFFDRIKKSQILGFLGQFDPELPGRYATAKSAELASAAARLCAGDTISDPEVKARALAWVPDAMRFATSGDAGQDELAPEVDSAEPGTINIDTDARASDAANQNEAEAPVQDAA